MFNDDSYRFSDPPILLAIFSINNPIRKNVVNNSLTLSLLNLLYKQSVHGVIKSDWVPR